MASLKRKARESGPVKEERDVCLSDSVLELSVTVGYLGADVRRDEMACLDSLLRDHCIAGVVALERGETEDHLHFQMVVRARCKHARSFGILVRKYMGWYGRRGMSPVGKVTCKVLTNRFIHTFVGMIGYCLKDAGSEHFDHCMFNVSDEDVIAGKTLHTIYGRADSRKRVTLTNKNITDRMYVWHKYRTQRKLTATFLTTLTDMIQSGIFIPSAAWIIPLNGQGMDHKRMTSLWKCITDPQNVCKTDIQEIFVKKRNFVKGRYFDADDSLTTYENDDDGPYSPVFASTKGFDPDKKPSPAVCKSALKSSCRTRNVNRVLFEDDVPAEVVKKKVCFDDKLGDFLGLKETACMINHEYLNTTNSQYSNGSKVMGKDCEHDGDSLLRVAAAEVSATGTRNDIIDLSSDSEDEPILCESGSQVFFDRTKRVSRAPGPSYNTASYVIKKEPLSPFN